MQDKEKESRFVNLLHISTGYFLLIREGTQKWSINKVARKKITSAICKGVGDGGNLLPVPLPSKWL